MEQWAGPSLLLLALLAVSLGVLFGQDRLAERHRDAGTAATVRLIANLFTVMTSLALGLMISSAKGTFDNANRDVHQFAAGAILFDRTLARYGHDADVTRQKFHAFISRTIGLSSASEESDSSDLISEQLLYAVGDSLANLKPKDEQRLLLWRDARQQLQELISLRWTLLEDSKGTIPAALLVLLGAWLTLMFASFAYLAPRNLVVVASLCLAAFLVSAAVFVIIDMDEPYSGPVYVDQSPFAQALQEMRRM